MKISDYRGEDAIELLADLIEPVSFIIGDDEFRDKARAGVAPLGLAKYVLKAHKREVLEILARIDGKDPKDYKPGIFELPSRVMELFNDEDFMSLFTSQAGSGVTPAFGSAMENTEENGKE